MIFSLFRKKFYIMLSSHVNTISIASVVQQNSYPSLVWQRKRYRTIDKLVNQLSWTPNVFISKFTVQARQINIHLSYAHIMSKTGLFSLQYAAMSIITLTKQPYDALIWVKFWINVTSHFFLLRGCFIELYWNILYFHKDLKFFTYKVTKNYYQSTTSNLTNYLFSKL